MPQPDPTVRKPTYIELDLPDRRQRQRTLETLLDRVDNDVTPAQVTALAAQLSGRTNADLEEMVGLAQLVAAGGPISFDCLRAVATAQSRSTTPTSSPA